MSLLVMALVGWIVVAGLMDFLQRKVRWWWSLLGLFGAAVYRLAVWVGDGFDPEQALTIFVVVTLSYSLWRHRWWGGADAKTAMALIIVIPDLIFLGVFAFLTLLISGLILLLRRGDQTLGQVIQRTIRVVDEGKQEGERLPLVALMAITVLLYLVFIALLE